MAILSRRALLGTAALAGLGGSPVRAASNTVRMGYIGDYQNASLPAIAADQKLWEAEGLQADVRVFTNGPIQIQAMGAGSLDFGAIGPGALWLPASGRTKVVAVNLLTFSDRLLAQPGITSVQQLKGKKVGVPPGTSGEMILRLTLAKAGMTVDDISVVPGLQHAGRRILVWPGRRRRAQLPADRHGQKAPPECGRAVEGRGFLPGIFVPERVRRPQRDRAERPCTRHAFHPGDEEGNGLPSGRYRSCDPAFGGVPGRASRGTHKQRQHQ